MIICNYCGRNFKFEYETCPGCGSNSFKHVADSNNIIIKTPPAGGYKVKKTNIESEEKFAKIFRYIGIALIVISFIFIIPFILGGMMSYDSDRSFAISFIVSSIIMSLIPCITIATVFILVAKKYQKNVNNNMKKLEKLAMNGMLIKNMNYELTTSGTVINGKPIYCVKVIYKGPNGVEIPLISDAKYDGGLGREDGTVDLLIDPKDFSNYYIDFEIY